MIERLMSVASELRRLVRERVIESELEWPNQLKLTRLRPVKPWRGHVTNKGGRIVLRGESTGRQVKLYEASTPEHAVFIEALRRTDEIGAWFPDVIARCGRCLVTEWVDGAPPPVDVSASEIAEIAVALHRVTAQRLPPRGYDFWGDFLRPRFIRAGEMIGASVDDIVALVDTEVALDNVLVHPDLRPANLVRRPDGRWALIDNEYCSTSGLPLLDVAHTARAFGTRSNEYWRSYVDLWGSRPSDRTIAALQGAWLARLVGSAFVGGMIGEGAKALRDYRSGRNMLPFDPGLPRS